MPGLFTIHHFGVDRKVQCPDFLRSTTLAWIVKSNDGTLRSTPLAWIVKSNARTFTIHDFGVDRKVQCPDFTIHKFGMDCKVELLYIFNPFQPQPRNLILNPPIMAQNDPLIDLYLVQLSD